MLTRGPKDSGATDAHGAPRLWSASSGRVFSATDDHMDLLSVSVLFTTSHLWANVQQKAKPWEVRVCVCVYIRVLTMRTVRFVT